jgi:hypothetical protein
MEKEGKIQFLKKKRKFLEINELYTSDDKSCIKLADLIKQASCSAYNQCEDMEEDLNISIGNNSQLSDTLVNNIASSQNASYNIFTDLERRTIELEEWTTKQQKDSRKKINAIIEEFHLNNSNSKTTCQKSFQPYGNLFNNSHLLTKETALNISSRLIDHITACNVNKLLKSPSQNTQNTHKEIDILNSTNKHTISISSLNKHLRFNLLSNLFPEIDADKTK